MKGRPEGIVDSHAHVFARDLAMVAGRRYTPDVEAPLPAYLDVLRELSATRAVLIQPSFLGTDNRFMLEAVGRYPERLRAVVVVEPTIAVTELDTMRAAGVVGIRLNLFGEPTPDLSSHAWDSLLAFVADADWHVELHCEAQRLEWLIPPLLARGCRVVVDHFGRPDLGLGPDDPGLQFLLRSAASRRVWVKLSASYRLGSRHDDQPQFQQLIEAMLAAFSADFLVWGSDWPHSQHPDVPGPAILLANFAQHVRNPDDLQKILSTTPQRLFHF